MADDAQLAREFRAVHQKLTSSGDVAAARQRLVDLACVVIEGCEWAAITVWPTRRSPRTVASTGAVSQQVDQVQYEAREGPCLTATGQDSPVWMPDLVAETRWPAFVQGALVRTPVRSALSFHLADDPQRSALNLYAGTPGVLDTHAVTNGALFATHAAVLMAHADSAQETVGLEQALRTSRLIGSAIGILMKTHQVTEDVAFRMLRATSNRLNRKLREVAEDVKDTGQLPQ